MNYDVNYFIKKFEAIPEELWISDGMLHRGHQHCAYGHCGYDGANTIEGKALTAFVRKYLPHPLCGVAHINDGESPYYQQLTPKQRVLAALYDIKAMQEKKTQKVETKRNDITKQLAVLPIDETSDVENVPVTNN